MGSKLFLPPSMLAGPATSTSTIMANNHPGLRIPTSLPTRSPDDYITSGTLVCFNERGSFFHFVEAPTAFDMTDATRDSWFAGNKDDTLHFWPVDPANTQTKARQYAYLNSAAGQGHKDPDTRLCRSPKFVAFPHPLMLPIGYICPVSEGMEGIERVLFATQPFAAQETHTFLQHALLLEFALKAKTYPAFMSSTWHSRDWIKTAFTEHSTSPGWLTPGDCDLWLDAERRLAFRLHHDYLATTARMSPVMRNGYFRYIERAYEGIYTAASDLTSCPQTMAGEI
jgi:hypothetical protein